MAMERFANLSDEVTEGRSSVSVDLDRKLLEAEMEECKYLEISII